MVLATDVCNCCGLEVVAGVQHCSVCQDHFYIPGESRARRDDRLFDHKRRVVPTMSPSARELADARERVASALRSRDAWRSALVQTMVHHEPEDEGCRCGARHYPCPSVETLERINRGIARRVEDYLAMSPEDMKHALDGDDSFPGALDGAG
jgi:hypothetical protein